MNMHTPQSIETVCELKFLASVENQIVSPQGSKPVISPVQDSLLGAFLLSKQKTIPYYYYYSIIKKLYNYDDYYVQNYINKELNANKISLELGSSEEDINDYLYNKSTCSKISKLTVIFPRHLQEKWKIVDM